LQDDSPNVRLEALTLLGNFVKNSTIGAVYFEKVAASLKDTAPSVRKAAIKILFEAFVVGPDPPKATEACQIILQMASDSQDHNRELVVTYFRGLWFPSQGAPALLEMQLVLQSQDLTASLASRNKQDDHVHLVSKASTAENHTLEARTAQ